MSQPVPSQVPYKFTAGDTVSFQINNQTYPASLYTAGFWLFAQNVDPDNFAGVAQMDGSFIFSATPAATDTILPENYQAVIVYTSIAMPQTRNTVIARGSVWVLPDPTQQAAPSPAQATLTLLQNAMSQLAAGTIASATVNQQTWTKKNMAQLQQQIYVQQSIVKDENDTIAQLMGRPNQMIVHCEFDPVCGYGKWPGYGGVYPGFWNYP